MSRTTSSNALGDYVHERGYAEEGFVPRPYQSWKDYDYDYRFIRSDVTNTRRDSLNWRAPTNYDADLDDIEYWKGKRESYWSDNTGVRRYFDVQSGCLSGILPTLSIPSEMKQYPNSLISRAEVRALLKARDQKVNLALTFAEIGKSQAMITSRVTQLYRGYSQARKGNFKAAAKALGIGGSKRNAKTWLELQYGWLPLLSDIHGAYEEMTRQARTNGFLFNVSSTVSEPVSVENDYSTYRSTITSRLTGVHSAKVSLWYTVTFSELQALSRVGLTNPLEIAWELTPWSFVIDWLVPVGDFLGALTATQGLTFKSGTRTTYTRLDLTGKAVFLGGRSPSGDVYDDKGSANYSAAYMKMRRTTYTGSPIPTPYVKNPFSVGHTLNAIALLRTLL